MKSSIQAPELSRDRLAAVGVSCNCLALRRAARAAARRYDEAFRPLDLNNGQFSMLAVVAAVPNVGIQAIAERLGMDRTTVTAGLKPLIRRGLATVDVDARDHRARGIRITSAGTDLLKRALPLWQAAQDAVAAQLGATARVRSFRRQLAAIE
jgi:DNA-binding MarR family transcriptional regulator